MFSNLNFCCCKVLFAKLEACRHTGKAWVLQIIPVCRTHYTAWNVRGMPVDGRNFCSLLPISGCGKVRRCSQTKY